MRSLLIQASSVEKAVDKAWSDAGQPTEFSIKILDFGEKGFLGITKRAAIVSILYEPQKQTAKYKGTSKRTPQPHSHAKKKPYPKPKPRIQETKPLPAKPRQERVYWTDTLVDNVTGWFKELTEQTRITSPFQAKVNRKALIITFDQNVLDRPEDERMLFSSFSYLLMQFMKKKDKKKYQGYQLIITSKRFENKIDR